MIPITAVVINRIRVGKFYPILYSHLHHRFKSTNKNKLTPSPSIKDSEIDTNVKPLSEKVKETTKTTTYLGIILIGVGVCGVMFYTIFSELFSGNSPHNLYSKATKKCMENNQVSDKLGYPISAYGEETRRGRRQHVSHAYYIDREGRKHIRMTFHLKGTAHLGTAHLDMIQTDSGNYEYRYLFVEVADMFKNVIVVEDNRSTLSSQLQSSPPSLELQL